MLRKDICCLVMEHYSMHVEKRYMLSGYGALFDACCERIYAVWLCSII